MYYILYYILYYRLHIISYILDTLILYSPHIRPIHLGPVKFSASPLESQARELLQKVKERLKDLPPASRLLGPKRPQKDKDSGRVYNIVWYIIV